MELIDRFRAAIQIKTDWPKGVLPGDAAAEAPLTQFQKFLVKTYPSFHQATERQVHSPYAVTYCWRGSGKGSEKSALILAHYDVVPVEAEKWTVDPFGAEIKDGYVYGRGTADMKAILIGIMEAAERLCERGFKPANDIWFAFGGDEERSGPLGAEKTAAWFAEQGIRFSWILDEGTPIGVNQIKGIDSPLALFGIEEKGYLSLNLTVKQNPGHASRPPKVQAAAVLGQALTRLAKKPFPFRLSPTVESTFTNLAKFAPGGQGWAMAHARLLGNIFFKAVAGSPDIASMLRTTVAMTQLSGSSADNVMPSEVQAVINLRLLDPWTVQSAMTYIKNVINDERVAVTEHRPGSNPVPANPDHVRLSGPGWQKMAEAMEQIYPGIPLIPFLMVATTDSRHYRHLAEGIFRFSPHKLDPQELARIHGHDERISLENLTTGARFYEALFERL
jgi:carboxypeptidase PM20D1